MKTYNYIMHNIGLTLIMLGAIIGLGNGATGYAAEEEDGLGGLSLDQALDLRICEHG